MKEKVSKRILGFLTFIVATIMAFLSGFDNYNYESMVIGIVYGYSAILLGIDAWKHVKKDELK